MKKQYLNFVLFMCITLLGINSVNAQYCGSVGGTPSGPTVCTPGGPYPALGFYPSYDSIPCAEIGTYYDQKIDMQIPATVPYNGFTATISTIHIDSIENLPCGLCWSSDDVNNTFAGNSTHCIRVTGTTYDKPGQFNLRIQIDISASVSGFPAVLNDQNAGNFGIKYFLHVNAPGGPCAAIDTLAAGNRATAPGNIATPSITGTTTLCSGQNTTLGLSTPYQTYVWSTGALTPTITVNNAGTYTVTVYDHCSSATASVNVTSGGGNAAITASGPTTFCTGGSVTLTATGGGTYLWSNNATTDAITVTQSGTYTVTVSNNGCTAVASQGVTVTSNSLNPSITPSSADICAGGSATLDAGNGYDSYAWSNSSNLQTLTTGTAGTYTVTVTQGSCSGTATATINVGNFPVSVSISPAGPVSGCVGDQVTLDAGNGYDAYNWSNGGSAQTTTVTTSGQVIVTVTDNGCVGKDTVDVTLNAAPSPSITPAGPQTICAGQTVQLNAGAGFSSYSWSNGSTTASIVVSNAGTYDVTVTQNGCSGASTGAVTVTVVAIPDATIWATGTGAATVLHTTPDADSYQWYLNNNAINNATDSTYQAASAGSYSVVTSNGTCTDTATFTISGISQIASVANFNLMPNPAKDMVTISFEMKEAGMLQVYVTDLAGRKVLTVLNGNTGTGLITRAVNLQGLSQGLYLVNIVTESGTFNSKFVKE